MQQIAALAALVPLVAAHGFISSPTPRKPGDAFAKACGQQPYYQQSSDINGNVQGILQVVGSGLDSANCNLWLCKGFQYEDNKASVQSYSLGQSIDFKINIAAPHTGVANVSVVKTSSNSIIGEPLIEFDNYASNAGYPANNTAFSVTLPSDLSGDCTTAGDCVLQWFWDAPDIDQTYEACVDFTVGGGSGSPVSSSAAASSPAATKTLAPTSAAQTPVATTVRSQAPSSAVTPVPASSSTTPSGSQPTGDDECEDDGDDDSTGSSPASTSTTPSASQPTTTPTPGGDDECEDEGDDDTNTGDDDECEDEGNGETGSPVTSSRAASTAAPAATSAAAVGVSSSKQSVVAQPTPSTVYVTVTAKPSTVSVTVTAKATQCA